MALNTQKKNDNSISPAEKHQNRLKAARMKKDIIKMTSPHDFSSSSMKKIELQLNCWSLQQKCS